MDDRIVDLRNPLRTTMDSMLDPFVIMVAARDERGDCVDFECVYANPAASASGAMAGRRLLEFAPETRANGLFDALCKVLATGVPLAADDYPWGRRPAYAPESRASRPGVAQASTAGPGVAEPGGTGLGVQAPGGQEHCDIRAVKVRDGLSLTWRNVTTQHGALAALRRSEEQFRMSMASAPIGMALVDLSGRPVEVNRALCDFFGRSQEQLLATTWQELTHPDDIAADEELLAEVLAGRSHSYRVTKRYLHADGSIRYGDLAVAAVRAADGSLDHFISQVVDITEQRRAEQWLKDRESMYRLLSENASDLVYRAGADRIIRWVAPSITRALGWEPGELVGTRMADWFHPEDAAGSEDLRVQYYSGAVERSAPLLIRMRTKGGGYRWMSAQVTSITDAQGNPDGLVGGMRDVDDLVAARDAAEAANAELRRTQLTIDSAAIAMSIVDGDGILKHVNRSMCQMFGYPKEQLVGKHFSTLNHPDDDGTARRLGRELADGQREAFSLRKEYPTATGGRLWVDLKASAVRDTDGSLLHLIVQMQDVTAEVDNRTALERSEAQLRLAMLGAPNGIVIAGPDDRVMRVNPAMCAFLGRCEDDLLGIGVDSLVQQAVGRPGIVACPPVSPDDVIPGHLHHVTVGPRDIWVEHSASLLRAGDGAPMLFIHHFSDQTAAQRLQAELAYRADHDSLTGLANREGLHRRLRDRRVGTSRGSRSMALLFCDVDSFKQVNDRLGHDAGDQVLAVVAQRLRGAVRASDFVSRYGGDEFVVVLDGISGPAEAERVAEKVRRGQSAPLDIGGRRVQISLSVGIAMVHNREEPDQALRRADQALLRAKQSGRDRLQVADD